MHQSHTNGCFIRTYAMGLLLTHPYALTLMQAETQTDAPFQEPVLDLMPRRLRGEVAIRSVALQVRHHPPHACARFAGP
jgi:hypothetical protein